MKRFVLLFLILILSSCFSKEKRVVLVKKWFKNGHTFEIICKGYPLNEATGKARIETAKEAALINAQFCAKDIFDDSVDVVKNGTIKKYTIHDDYVVIHYVIKYKGLKKKLRKKK